MKKMRRTIPPKGSDEYWHLYQYKDMIHYKAWQIHKRTGRDFNECLSDCYLIYCEACQNHDPIKSSFSTYLWLMINWKYKQLNTSLIKNGITTSLEVIPLVTNNSNMEHDIIFKNQILNLSEEAKQIVNYCFDRYNNNDTKNLVQYKIKNQFVKNGMPVFNTGEAVKEIKREALEEKNES